MKSTDVPVNIDSEMYNRLLRDNEMLRKEMELFKQKSPLVGLRWYGDGGFGIGLTYMVNGKKRVALEGYGDTEVIDYTSWIRIRGTEAVEWGILVRDDSVINEMGVSGVNAKPDRNKNINAFTDVQIIKILSGSVKNIKDLMEATTHHFPAQHFIRVANNEKFENKSKLAIVHSRYDYLFTRFKWSLIHHHDLRQACESAKIIFEGRDDRELVESLTQYDLREVNG